MKFNYWKTLFIISFVVLISGILIISIGAYQKNVALIVSGIGLVGSFVGMYASALNTKRQMDKERPYFILKTNEDRYGLLQLELYNAGINSAIIKKVFLNQSLPLLTSESTLSENLVDSVVQGKESVSFPYLVYNNGEYNSYYVDVEGTLEYVDFSGEPFSNKVVLNLSNFRNGLSFKKESIKRDNEIIKTSKSIESISENINSIKRHYTKS